MEQHTTHNTTHKHTSTTAQNSTQAHHTQHHTTHSTQHTHTQHTQHTTHNTTHNTREHTSTHTQCQLQERQQGENTLTHSTQKTAPNTQHTVPTAHSGVVGGTGMGPKQCQVPIVVWSKETSPVPPFKRRKNQVVGWGGWVFYSQGTNLLEAPNPKP